MLKRLRHIGIVPTNVNSVTYFNFRRLISNFVLICVVTISLEYFKLLVVAIA